MTGECSLRPIAKLALALTFLWLGGGIETNRVSADDESNGFQCLYRQGPCKKFSCSCDNGNAFFLPSGLGERENACNLLAGYEWDPQVTTWNCTGNGSSSNAASCSQSACDEDEGGPPEI